MALMMVETEPSKSQPDGRKVILMHFAYPSVIVAACVWVFPLMQSAYPLVT